MAASKIGFKNTTAVIKGDIEHASLKDQVDINSLQFGLGAMVQHADEGFGSKTGSASQTSISFMVNFGPWIAEFQQALFHGKTLGKVTFTEIIQKADNANNPTWGVLRTLDLEDAWVDGMSQAWTGIHSTFAISLSYKKSIVTWGKKIAEHSNAGI